MGGGLVFLLLRVVHVVGGVLWVGAAVLLASFLLPSVRALGAGGGPVMQQMTARRLPVYMGTLAVLSVVSGFALYWHDSAGFRSHEWLRSGSAMAFGLAGVLAVSALVLGATVISPATERLGALAQAMQRAGGPPTAEQLAGMRQLETRLARAAGAGATLLVITAILMAIARYV